VVGWMKVANCNWRRKPWSAGSTLTNPAFEKSFVRSLLF
jgi:hypothetical protein